MKIIWMILIIFCVFLIGFGVYSMFTTDDDIETPIENPDDPDEDVGFYSQKLIVNYQDGTNSDDVISGYLYHDDKKIEDFTYQLYVTPETNDRVEFILQYYYFTYEITQSGSTVKTGYYYPDTMNKGAEGRTLLVEETFDPFQFINYTYPDGTYTIKIIPSGDILMDNEQVNLPDSFSLIIEMIDERSIDIDFSG